MASHRHALWVLAFVAFHRILCLSHPARRADDPDDHRAPVARVPDCGVAPRWRIGRGGCWGTGSVIGAFELIGPPGAGVLRQGRLFRRILGPLCRMGAHGRCWSRGHAVSLQGHHHPVGRDGVVACRCSSSPPSLARALRFFIVAALLWKFGAPIRDFIERRLGLVFIVFVVLLAGGFYAVRFCESMAHACSLWRLPGRRAAAGGAGVPVYRRHGACALCIWQRWPHVVALVAGAGLVLPGPWALLGAFGTGGRARSGLPHRGRAALVGRAVELHLGGDLSG